MLRLAEGALCGIAAGIVSGIAARIAMRMVADGVPDGIRQFPTFTLEGSAAIVVIAALAGAPFGAIFNATHDALPGPRRGRGLLFGLVLLVLVGPLFFIGTPDEFITRQRVVLFIVLFPIYGAAAGLALEPSRRSARWLAAPVRALPVLVALGGGALVAAGLAGLASQSIQLHGAPAIALGIPWIALALWLSRRWLRALLPHRRDAHA